MERKIPKTMSTQHPDNAKVPFFSDGEVLHGENEIKEAYYIYSHLGCDEQMWDYEGKEIDEFVVRKLLTQYPDYFRQNIIGKDLFLTLRVPNPTVEKAEAKLLLEVLESIPRSFDAANLFYNHDIPPIFEVILPMTTRSQCLSRIYYYYKDYVIGRETKNFFAGDITIREWIGEFFPKEIFVIPLIEDIQYILTCDKIVEEYISGKNLPYIRVFLGRSDPAMNYSSLATVLALKIAFLKLQTLEEKTGIPIHPILGAGVPPFRGNFNPYRYKRTLSEFPSAETFTIQSAFKYDYPIQDVTSAINDIKTRKRERAQQIDIEKALGIIEKVSKSYQERLKEIAEIVNELSPFVPQRRARKLHIGLFGYSREARGIRLPRAIPFCATLYSVGLPPDVIGLEVLSDDELTFVRAVYPSFEEDLKDALQYYNPKVLDLLSYELKKAFISATSLVRFEQNEEHKNCSSKIIDALDKKNFMQLKNLITEASYIRKFLG